MFVRRKKYDDAIADRDNALREKLRYFAMWEREAIRVSELERELAARPVRGAGGKYAKRDNVVSINGGAK